jgi:hypothetical protein
MGVCGRPGPSDEEEGGGDTLVVKKIF